jgi:hypothetical protein
LLTPDEIEQLVERLMKVPAVRPDPPRSTPSAFPAGVTLDRNLRAALIAEIQAIRERAETLLELLIPGDGAACPHPSDHVQDIGAMGEPSLYHCSLCGAEQAEPFHPLPE